MKLSEATGVSSVDKRQLVGRIFTKPMLFKTFMAWTTFVEIRKAEKLEQQKLYDAMKAKEEKRKALIVPSDDDGNEKKRRKAKAVALDPSVTASINAHISKKETEKAQAQEERREEIKRKKSYLSVEDRRLMQERLLFEAAERDRKEGHLTYGYFGSGGPVERGSMKPMWAGLLRRMEQAGMVERPKFSLLDLLKPSRKVSVGEVAGAFSDMFTEAVSKVRNSAVAASPTPAAPSQSGQGEKKNAPDPSSQEKASPREVDIEWATKLLSRRVNKPDSASELEG